MTKELYLSYNAEDTFCELDLTQLLLEEYNTVHIPVWTVMIYIIYARSGNV